MKPSRDLINDIFDPEDISKEEMEKIAEMIEEYLNLLEDVMIIPEELYETHHERIEKGINVTKKLIKKLKKGDRSVFNDSSKWKNQEI